MLSDKDINALWKRNSDLYSFSRSIEKITHEATLEEAAKKLKRKIENNLDKSWEWESGVEMCIDELEALKNKSPVGDVLGEAV